MKKRSIPSDTEIGPTIHLRLRAGTDAVFGRKAKELAMAKAVYVRVWIEKMFKDYGLVGFSDEG